MDTVIKILIGVVIAVVAGYLTLFLRRARLKVYSTPNRRCYFEDLYSPDLNLKIVNLGYEKAEIDTFKLEFKKGHKVIFVEEDLLHKSLVSIDAKSSTRTMMNCHTVYKNNPEYFKNYPLVRVLVITPSNRMYKSNWIETKYIIEEWGKIL